MLPIPKRILICNNSYYSYFDAMSIEPTIPQTIPFEEKKSIYQYQSPTKDKYPPHLDVIPTKDQTVPWKIFNAVGLLDAASLLPKIVPDTFLGAVGSVIQSTFLDAVDGEPWRGPTIADVERRNKYDKQSGTDIERGANIGDLPDWYSDARFAQQQFTGTNPTTITGATAAKLGEFKAAAKAQGLTAVTKLLDHTDTKDLYMQDCSYFREACGYQADDVMIDEDKMGNRFGCAAVTLFILNSDGQLHPLAICPDYKVSMEKSVVIFNKRLSPSDSTASEKEDWPWRYAKTCAQVSDWIRHEVTVHLTDTHFMEEDIIVATHRCIPVEHPVFKLLEPHWLRTLSLNAAARETLVPKIIFDLVGVPNDKLYGFVKYAFQNYDFQNKYIPKDLPARGFPLEQLNDPKFKNYAYGKNMILMWNAIRTFVNSMIAINYKSDDQVANDAPIQAWCHEIRSPTAGQMPSFPTITTIPALVDAITMCIHIAAPQHTAVNYLQDFYQAFVINKPPSLLSPIPTSLSALQSFKETDLTKALPIGHQRLWLLSAHIPHLLSFKVADENNLINYALSLWHLYKKKMGPGEQDVMAAAEAFYGDLWTLRGVFEKNSEGMSVGTVPYNVMDPNSTAVSILI